MNIFGVESDLIQKLTILKKFDLNELKEQKSKVFPDPYSFLQTQDGKHVNPHLLAQSLNLQRYQEGEWYNFSKQVSDKNFVDYDKTKEDIFSSIKTLFARNEGDANLFMIGPYHKIAVYVSNLSDEKGERILGKDRNGVGRKLFWTAFCPDPYLQEEISDEYPEYDKYKNFPNSRWLCDPNGNNKLNVNSLAWLIKYSARQPSLSKFSYYMGTERIQPDYSKERFLEDYIGILSAYTMIEANGNSMFTLIWPVNSYAAGVLGILSLFYENLKFRREVDAPLDHPTIEVYGMNKKTLSPEIIEVIYDIRNFDSLVLYYNEAGSQAFLPFFQKEFPRIEAYLKTLETKFKNEK